MKLLGFVEVPKSDRIRCDHEGCDHTVYKKIHVVETDDGLRLIGGTCYRHHYRGLVDESEARYGGGEGYLLTPAEREQIKENTEALRSILEQRYAEYLARLAEENQAAAPGQRSMAFDEDPWPADDDDQEDDDRPGDSQPGTGTRTLTEYDRWAMEALSPGRCVHPSVLPADEGSINDRDILAFAYFIERTAIERFGLDPDLPGWVGLVKAKAVTRFRLMAQARKAGLPDWRKAGGVSSFARMANARESGQAGWWQSDR